MADSTDDFTYHGTARVPNEVYIITVSSEWAIDVISGHPASHVAPDVEHIVNKRRQSGNVPDMHYIKIFKAKLTDIEEVEFVPPQTLPSRLKAKGG